MKKVIITTVSIFSTIVILYLTLVSFLYYLVSEDYFKTYNNDYYIS